MRYYAQIFLFLSVYFLSILSGNLYAQPVNNLVKDVVMPPPNAAALGKYGDVPIDYSSGTPSISIPIHTLKEGSVSLPITLNYHPSGIKVAELASWVGLGWSLDVGGMVSRTVLGITDETALGYWANGTTIDTSSRDYICELSKGNHDGEPDLFSYSVTGYSGKFFFDKDHNIFMVPKNPDLKIETDYNSGGGGGFVSFTIITPDGTRYIFGKDNATGTIAYETLQAGSALTYRTSWMLLRIESFDQKFSLTYSYTNENYNYKTPASCEYVFSNIPGQPSGVSCPGTNGEDIPKHKYLSQNISGKRLSTITSSLETVTFVANTVREDLEATNKLDKIQISTTGYCFTYDLTHDYFVDPLIATYNYSYFKRLQLKKLQKIACSPATEQENAFDFLYEGPVNSGKVFLPHRLSKATDHWGFYNGKETPNSTQEVNVPPTTVINPITGIPFNYGGSNRNTDSLFLKYGVLKQINYPTGGNTNFVFESNTAKMLVPAQTPAISNLTTCGTPGPACCGTLISSQNYTFASSLQISQSFFDLELVGNASSGICGQCYSQVTVQIFNGATQVGSNYSFNVTCSPYFASVIKAPLSAISNSLSPGVNYTFKVTSLRGKGTFNLYAYTQVNADVAVGGVRIKRIRTNDGVTSTNDIFRTYEYKEASGNPLFTSGTLLNSLPVYGRGGVFTTLAGGLLDYYRFTADSQVPLGEFDGRHIIYTRVVENETNNGKTVYEYSLDNSNSYNPLPIWGPAGGVLVPSVPQLYKVNFGQLSKTTTFDQAATEVDKAVIETAVPSYEYAPGYFLKIESLLCLGGHDNSIYGFTLYQPRTDFYKLTKRTETANQAVVTVTDLTYDASERHSNPVSVSMTNSDAKVHRTELFFNHDYPVTSARTGLLAKNLVASPYKTAVKVDNVQVGGTELEYAYFHSTTGAYQGTTSGDFTRLYKFHNFEITWNAAGTLTGIGKTLKATINDYDGNGNPKTFTQVGWEPELYEWGAGGLITKRTFNSNDATAYKKFVTQYNYYTGTRLLSKITAIDEQFSEFEYDPLMRLSNTKGRKTGTTYNVQTDYAYQFKNGTYPRSFVKAKTTFTATSGSSLTEKTLWQYMDGLGRPVQTVDQKHSPAVKDVVSVMTYDNRGRQDSVFNVFENPASPGNTGAFVATVPSGTPFTLTQYYSEPLNRVWKVTPPAWYATIYSYGANLASNVFNYTNSTNYAANLLHTTTVEDPNGNKSIAFKDKKGRLILSRRTNNAGSSVANTYNIYDNKDRLSTVIPPGAGSATTNLLFKYLYDASDNMIMKDVPDADAMTMKYNARNLMTLMQDGNLLAQTKWLGTEYDLYGRAVRTGFVTNGTDPNNFTFDAGGILMETTFDDVAGSQVIYKGKVKQSKVKVLDGGRSGL